MVQQYIHGRQYIDELVMVRVKNKGDLYVHQDANWNVIGLTDLGGHLVERYVYTPYGELTVHQTTGYGDRDGDGDVDSDDKGTPGTTCTGTVSGSCRILDLDFDGDYDSSDATLFDALPQGLSRHPGRTVTAVDQPFAHQGLPYDAEIMTYQNRARQYDPVKRRFVERDPLCLTGNGLRAGQRREGGAHPVCGGDWAARQYRDGVNLYGYVLGDPIGRTDPLGLFTNAECKGACDSLYSSGSWEHSRCTKICTTLGGKTCTALNARCDHIGRHESCRAEKVCRELYDELCG